MKYKVTIVRTTHTEKDFEVEAESEGEAHEKAIGVACDTEWKHDNAQYEVDFIEEVTGEK